MIESREEGAFVSAQLEALTSRSINFKLAIAIKLRHRNEHFENWTRTKWHPIVWTSSVKHHLITFEINLSEIRKLWKHYNQSPGHTRKPRSSHLNWFLKAWLCVRHTKQFQPWYRRPISVTARYCFRAVWWHPLSCESNHNRLHISDF